MKVEKISLEEGIDAEIYICKNECQDGTYFFNGECISKCPNSNNYIGMNNKCAQSCESDLRGEYYYDKKDSTITDYKIYKYTISCNIDGVTLYYKKEGEKECLEKCPDGYKYVIENTNDCLPKCPDDTTDHITCKNIACADGYILDGVCTTKENCKSAGKIYINSKNFCLNKCEEKFKIKI